jgi:hypothetical protein
MYLYVYDQNVYDELVKSGKQCLSTLTDINGATIWVFADDGSVQAFGFDGGYIRSPELRMSF